jgi:predicted molibdopterin-dependent oxidoreductase YjgC
MPRRTGSQRPATGRRAATTGRTSPGTTRDATWIASEKVGDKEVPVNRTDAIGFLGGAQNTNEECYLFQKAARLLGLVYVEHQARL